MGPSLALGFGLFLPAFGTHGLNATVQNIGSSLGLSEEQGFLHGVLMAAFALAALPGYAVAGPLGDRRARRPLIIAGIGGYALVHVGILLQQPLSELLSVPPIGVFLVLRLLAGFCGGVVFVSSNALLADLYPPEHRGKAMSLAWIGVPAALVLGVPLTAYLTPLVAKLPAEWQRFVGQPYALVALLVAAAAFVAVKRFVPEPGRVRPHPTVRRASGVFRFPVVLAPCVALMMPMAVFELLATVGDHTRRSFGWGEVEGGHLFVVLGIAGVAGGILSSQMVGRLGLRRCLFLAQSSFLLLVLVLPWVGALPFLFLGGLLSLLSTMRQGPFQAIAIGLVEPASRGALSAWILGAGAVGTSLGQLIGSTLMGDSTGFHAVAWTSAGWMFLAMLLTLPLGRPQARVAVP